MAKILLKVVPPLGLAVALSGSLGTGAAFASSSGLHHHSNHSNSSSAHRSARSSLYNKDKSKKQDDDRLDAGWASGAGVLD